MKSFVLGSQLGISCEGSHCGCAFPKNYTSGLASTSSGFLKTFPISIMPSTPKFFSLDDGNEKNYSLSYLIDNLDLASLNSCDRYAPICAVPHDDLLAFLNMVDVDISSQSQLLSDSNNYVFQSIYKYAINLQRDSLGKQFSSSSNLSSTYARKSVLSQLYRAKKNIESSSARSCMIMPSCAVDFLSSSGLQSFRDKTDALKTSSTIGAESALKNHFLDAAAINGFGDKVANSNLFNSAISSVQSPQGDISPIFVAHISSGFPCGLDGVINGSLIDGMSTWRPRGSSTAYVSWLNDHIENYSPDIFKRHGLASGQFCVRELNNAPAYMGLSSVQPSSLKSGSWYGFLPDPFKFVDIFCRPIYQGMLQSKANFLGIIITQPLEELLAIASSDWHQSRFQVRRALEHQFLGRTLAASTVRLKRDEAGFENVSGRVWDSQQVDPANGDCLPDWIWCPREEDRSQDVLGLIRSCSDSDSVWHAMRFRYRGLSSQNPFRGLSIQPNSYNSNLANALSLRSSLNIDDICDLIRSEMLQWISVVSMHLNNVYDTGGLHSGDDNSGWSWESSGMVGT